MAILPPDKPQEVDRTPHNFFIYGKPMSGKSFFAQYFPHPLFLNTDGNSRMNAAPSIQMHNVYNANGKGLSESVVKQLHQIIMELQTTQHTYQTIIVDVVDDLIQMIEQAICVENGVNSIGDIAYGKGYALVNSTVQNLVISLKALPYNVIYISREVEVAEDMNSLPVARPSLRDKYYNIVTGNCDLVVRCRKVGNNYLRQATEKRTQFKEADIKNEQILEMLKRVNNVFN